MKPLTRSLTILAVILLPLNCLAQSLDGKTFDDMTLLSSLSTYETILLFDNTSLALSEGEIRDPRRRQNSPLREARDDIGDSLRREFMYSDRNGSIDGIARQRQSTLNNLSEHLTPEEINTFKGNFVNVVEFQSEWQSLKDRVLSVMITELLTDDLKPALNEGIEGGSDFYFDMVNRWVRRMGNGNPNPRRLPHEMDVRRLDSTPQAKQFFENLMDLVDQGLISSTPVS
jgi:hypothetical protein